MAEKKKKPKPKNPGGQMGKTPNKNIKTEVSQVKHKHGSSTPKGKKGGIIRKPKPRI